MLEWRCHWLFTVSNFVKAGEPSKILKKLSGFAEWNKLLHLRVFFHLGVETVAAVKEAEGDNQFAATALGLKSIIP